MEQLITILASGADIATIAIVIALYRIDRRLFRVEIKTGIKDI